MKRLILTGVIAFGLVACAGGPGKNTISPAEALLESCSAYARAIGQVTRLAKANIMKEEQLKIVDMTIGPATAICGGNPPKVDASVLDLAIDNLTGTVMAVIASVGQES